MCSKFYLCFIIVIFSFFYGKSQNVLLKNIATGDGNTRIFSGTSHNGKFIFSGEKRDDQGYKDFIAISDGTPNNTQIVLEDYGLQASNFDIFRNALHCNGVTYFYDSSNLALLWRSDGTSSGTFLLHKRISGGLFVFNNVIYFAAESDAHGKELWRTDGTVSGTYMVADIVPNSGSSNPERFIVCNNQLFFLTNTNYEWRVWKTDGTAAGTAMVKDIDVLYTCQLEELNGFLYFSDGYKIWKSGGTPANTVVFWPGNNSDYFVQAFRKKNNRLFFYRNAINNLPTTLFSTDGTTVTQLLSLPISNYSQIVDIYAGHPNQLLLTVTDGLNKYELWKSDGTVAGTTMVKVINSNPDGQSIPGGRKSGNFRTIGNVSLFLGYDKSTGYELWKTDGTSSGTQMLKDMNNSVENSYYDNFMVQDGKFYFSSQDATQDANNELFVSDGTVQGTVTVKSQLSNNDFFQAVLTGGVGNKLFFVASSSIEGKEMWATDGTSQGTSLLKNYSTGSVASSNPSNFIGYNNKVYFIANNVVNGNEIWETDGTPQNTKIVLDITPKFSLGDYASSIDTELNGWTIYKGELYVMLNKKDLFKINKQSVATKVATVPNTNWNGKVFFAELNNNLYFISNSKLYRFDGTALTVAKSFGGYTFRNAEIINFKNKLYFAASGNLGIELWTSDGTENGTTQIGDIAVGSASSEPCNFVATDNFLFFVARTVAYGDEMWRTDGTAIGTMMLKDIAPGAAGGVEHLTSYFQDNRYVPVVLNNVLYFSGDEDLSTFPKKQSFWKSDGTIAGTVRLFNPNEDQVEYLVALKNKVYFHMSYESKLYQYDGTTTTLAKSLGFSLKIQQGFDGLIYIQNKDWPGVKFQVFSPDDASLTTIPIADKRSVNYSPFPPLNYILWNGFLIQEATTDLHGNEVWAYKIPCRGSYNLANPESRITDGMQHDYKTTGNISATNTINANTVTGFTSQSSIELKPGFSANSGAIFTAKISGCN